MKNIKFIIIFLVLTGCFSVKKTANKSFIPKAFVFNKSIVSSEDGVSKLKSKQDSVIDRVYPLNGKDSIVNMSLKKIKMTDFLTITPTTEILINIKNDSIWRYRKQNGKMIGDFFLIDKNKGILSYFDKSKTINYKNHNLFSHDDKYQILEDKTDKKNIQGFECYKLEVIKIDKKSDLGNTNYEMYVTNEIELPVHSVINLTKFIPNTFPLEIKVREEKLPGIIEFYQLIKVE
jgi:hypothetical protein